MTTPALLSLPPDVIRYTLGFLTPAELYKLTDLNKVLNGIIKQFANANKEIKLSLSCLKNMQQRKYQVLEKQTFLTSELNPFDDTRVEIGQHIGSIKIENNSMVHSPQPILLAEDRDGFFYNSDGKIKSNRYFFTDGKKMIQTRDYEIELKGGFVNITSKTTKDLRLLPLFEEKVEDIAVSHNRLLVITKKGLHVYELSDKHTLDHFFLASIKGDRIVSLKKGNQFVFMKTFGRFSLVTWEGRDLKTNPRDNPEADSYYSVLDKIIVIGKLFFKNVIKMAKIWVPIVIVFNIALITLVFATAAAPIGAFVVSLLLANLYFGLPLTALITVAFTAIDCLTLHDY